MSKEDWKDVKEVRYWGKLYRVTIIIGDDSGGETENMYFETKFAAERFLKEIPEATR